MKLPKKVTFLAASLKSEEIGFLIPLCGIKKPKMDF